MNTQVLPSIWVLFSEDNHYDQPPNNLVAWWQTKPDLETLAKAIGYDWPASGDETIVKIVKIWAGEEQRINDTDWRVEQLFPGKL